MHSSMILQAFSDIRSLKVEFFDLKEAVKSGQPVIFWHSFNYQFYTGYELSLENKGSNIAVGHPDPSAPETDRKAFWGMLSNSYFVEWNGKIFPSEDLWPEGYSLWIGDDLPDRYKLGFDFHLIKEGN